MKMMRFAVAASMVIGIGYGVAMAQENEFSVSDPQLEGDLLILDVMSPQAGWAVIHTVTDEGKVGNHVGHAAIEQGENALVGITLDQAFEEDEFIVMLHEDAGAAGTFEFGPDDKTDAPVMAEGKPVTAAINVAQ